VTRHYVDVGVQQIQTYLVRAQRLKGRRGASSMITKATSRPAVERCLSGLRAPVHDEAGHVDGVVSVLVEDPADVPDVVTRLVGALRTALPAAFLTAGHLVGDDYASAYDLGREDTWEFPAVSPEWVGAQRCDWCNVWPVVARIPSEDGDGKKDSVCRDCHARSAEGRATEVGNKPLAETRLLRELAGPADRDVPTTFDELARLSPYPDDNNHLATVFADGNAVGGLIAGLRRAAAQDPQQALLLRNAPGLIDGATWKSLVAAVRAISGDEPAGYWPVIAHLVGGDDLLTTVPAPYAWPFVRTYLREFADGVTPLARDGLRGSASAGVVFHQSKEPLSVVTDLAHDLLKIAKKEHSGLRAAVSWQSITHEGSAAVHERRSVALNDLAEHADALTHLATVPRSQRHVLARMLREKVDLDGQLRRIRFRQESTEPGEDVPHIALATLAGPFLGDNPVVPLTSALALTRWWST